MARINYPINEEHEPAKGHCHICDGRSSAIWMFRGPMFVEVCGRCALEKLPLIIADAISIDTNRDWFALEQAANDMKGSFWRGLAIRLMRENKELRSKAAPETGNS